jgi:serine protease Do
MKFRFFATTIILTLIVTSCSKGVKEIIKDAEKASFTIYTYDEYGMPFGTGSGFFIEEEGIGLTNYHVLDEATQAIILTSDKEKYEIDSIISADPDIDIIKFKIKNPQKNKFGYLEFNNELPEKGDKVLCISSPDRLTNSFSDGVVSSIRENTIEGKVIQFTAPVSPGSSGSAILNEKGNVIAITKYKRIGEDNESLNFGVYISDEIIKSINKDKFSKNNPKFSNRDKFIILNKKSDNDPHDILNAIEFGENGTTLYMSFTNTHLQEDPEESWGIYQDISIKEEESMYLKNVSTGIKYFLLSSTLRDRTNPTEVPLGTTLRYKQFFPKIDEIPKCITIGEPDTRSARWSNICIDGKNKLEYFNDEDFLFIYALQAIEEGNITESNNLLTELIDFDPSNVEALSMLGVLSYSINNNFEALKYFNRVIELNPNSPVHYVNRYIIFKQIGEIDKALEDISKAISLAPDQPEFYEAREQLYIDQGNLEKAMNDFISRDQIQAKDQKRAPLMKSSDPQMTLYKKILTKRN